MSAVFLLSLLLRQTVSLPLRTSIRIHCLNQYPLTQKDEIIIDILFNGLHQNDYMGYAGNHTPWGSAVFVIWKDVEHDSVANRKLRVVIDYCE